MRKWTVGVLLAMAISAWSTSAQAASITFVGFVPGGTIAYGGVEGTDPLTGSGIGLQLILGVDTPTPGSYACASCTLSFTTGANTGVEGPPSWQFGASGPATFTVTGGVPLLGIPAGSTLISGSVVVASATAADVPGNGVLLTVSVIGPDVKHADLVNAFGLTGSTFAYANTDISIDPTIDDTTGSFSGTVNTATITNTAAVPEPGSTMAFLGLGLLGVGMLRRKMLV